jgi:hypothetical protein
MLTKASNDGQFLTVLAESIELVGEGGLEFLTSDVGELSFGNEGLGFRANKLLLEDNDLGAIGLLVLELCNLICDLLLACKKELAEIEGCMGREHTVSAWLHRSLNIADALYGDAILVISIHELVLELSNLVDEHTELVGNIRDIVIACFAPDRQLLLHLDQPSSWRLDTRCTYRDFHSFSANQFHGAHDILLHLHQLRKLLREIWAECAGVDRLAERVA